MKGLGALAGPPSCCPLYTAKSGDTLSSVAASQLGSADNATQLGLFNGLPVSAQLVPQLQAGQVLQIPCPRALTFLASSP